MTPRALELHALRLMPLGALSGFIVALDGQLVGSIISGGCTVAAALIATRARPRPRRRKERRR